MLKAFRESFRHLTPVVLFKPPAVHPLGCWGVPGPSPSTPRLLPPRVGLGVGPHPQEAAGTPREEFWLDVASKCSSAKPRGFVGLARRPRRGLARPHPAGQHQRITLHTTNAIIYLDVSKNQNVFKHN